MQRTTIKFSKEKFPVIVNYLSILLNEEVEGYFENGAIKVKLTAEDLNILKIEYPQFAYNAQTKQIGIQDFKTFKDATKDCIEKNSEILEKYFGDRMKFRSHLPQEVNYLQNTVNNVIGEVPVYVGVFVEVKDKDRELEIKRWEISKLCREQSIAWLNIPLELELPSKLIKSKSDSAIIKKREKRAKKKVPQRSFSDTTPERKVSAVFRFKVLNFGAIENPNKDKMKININKSPEVIGNPESSEVPLGKILQWFCKIFSRKEYRQNYAETYVKFVKFMALNFYMLDAEVFSKANETELFAKSKSKGRGIYDISALFDILSDAIKIFLLTKCETTNEKACFVELCVNIALLLSNELYDYYGTCVILSVFICSAIERQGLETYLPEETKGKLDGLKKLLLEGKMARQMIGVLCKKGVAVIPHLEWYRSVNERSEGEQNAELLENFVAMPKKFTSSVYPKSYYSKFKQWIEQGFKSLTKLTDKEKDNYYYQLSQKNNSSKKNQYYNMDMSQYVKSKVSQDVIYNIIKIINEQHKKLVLNKNIEVGNIGDIGLLKIYEALALKASLKDEIPELNFEGSELYGEVRKWLFEKLAKLQQEVLPKLSDNPYSHYGKSTESTESTESSGGEIVLFTSDLR